MPAICSYSATPGSDVTHAGVSVRNRPSRPIRARVGRFSSRHQVTSVVSPKVQIIAIPEPLSGSASGCARTGTSTSKTGVRTVAPNSAW